MPITESMKASFDVGEVGSDPKPIIRIEPHGERLSVLVTDSDTLYLTLRENVTLADSETIAKYLREHLTGVALLKYP